MDTPRVFISAAAKSSGKTAVSVGLCAALRGRGYRAQAFKKGPDYIDPMWLSEATGRPCYNLDFNTQSLGEIVAMWRRHAGTADIGLIEGNKGLFDGVDPKGSDCNAAMAKLIAAPVILVVDTRGVTRGIAPLVTGYERFDPAVNIIGVILNKVGGDRHEEKLRRALGCYTDLTVIGAIRRHDDMAIDERHLGLTPCNAAGYGAGFAAKKIAQIKACVEKWVDIDKLVGLLALPPMDNGRRRDSRGEPRYNRITLAENKRQAGSQVTIGIAQDAAFGFYYHDDLAEFARHGAKLMPIDFIKDKALPDIDGLFIGGGFPETSMRALAENRSLRAVVREAALNDMPIYAECGGLMYLCRGIRWGGEYCEMAGVIPADARMHERPRGRGLVRLLSVGDAPWRPAGKGGEIRAHEFHHSTLENIKGDLRYAYEVTRGHGVDGARDGIRIRNTLANYAHLRSTEGSPWVPRFIDFVRQHKRRGT